MTFYGILKKAAFEEALARWLPSAETRSSYQFGSCFRCLGERGSEYSVRAVSLLKHFQEKYHSANGMRILLVEEKDILNHLPAGNPDCLIVGVKERDQFQPIIVLASHVDLFSDTLSMEVITDQRKLQKIKMDWENVLWERALPVENAIRSITSRAPQMSSAAKTGAAS